MNLTGRQTHQGGWHATRALAVLLALVLQSGASAADADRQEVKPSEEGRNAASARPLDEKFPASSGLIVVPDNDVELIGMASALSARLTRDGTFPLMLIADRSKARAGGEPAFALPASCVFLSRDADDRRLPLLLPAKSTFTARLSGEGAAAGLELARRAWGTADTVVLASGSDPGAQILAAALATRLGVPYLPVGDRSEAKRLTAGFGQLGVKRVLVVVHAARKPPPWAGQLRPVPRVLDQTGASELMVKAMGRDKVRNVILVRVPEELENGWAYESAWVAPHLSFARNSVIVLRSDKSGSHAERSALGLIASLKIKPRSVTIIGNEEAIADIVLTGDARLGGYDLRVEPCSGFPRSAAVGLAVGRIPCSTLSQASLLVNAGLARERQFSTTAPRVVMIANPATGHSALPLCETVARFNSEDLKNRGVHVDEFYGKPSNDAPVIAAAQKAHFIFFQGHVSDQNLFDRGWDLWNGGFAGTGATERDAGPTSGSPEPSARRDADTLAPSWLRVEDRRGAADERGKPVEATQQLKLTGAPVVFLQSCSSLEPALAQSVFDTGSVGLIGSVTSIHSASGSAFAKALSDGLVDRDNTVGEALRDARNYFLCLGELKRKRGHKEGAKVYRVALSFRFWGDPELRLNLARGKPARGARKPMRAAFKVGDTILLRVPRRRLPEVAAGIYRARMFAGSQAAGIVKTTKKKNSRRLLAMYFFRLDQPEGFGAKRFAVLTGPEGKGARSAFLADSFGRFVYVLHFPAKEKANEEITLRFRTGD